MGITTVVNMCSHLQNASKARLGLTSVKHTKYNLLVLLAMQRAGWVSYVTRGGPSPPDPASLSTYTPEPLTPSNVASARLWVGLKYGEGGLPVLGACRSITSSKRPLRASLQDLERLGRGFDAPGAKTRGLNLGESLILSTDRGVLEAREAMARKVGGLLLCRLSPGKVPYDRSYFGS